MTARAELVVDGMWGELRREPPPGLAVADVDAYFGRRREKLLGQIEQILTARDLRAQLPPDLWTPAKRRDANLAAMRVLARASEGVSDEDRRVLAGYSGWGGLTLQGIEWPAGVAVPEERGLIHEFYTPSKVAAEVSRIIQPFIERLADSDGKVAALEPSAGIGRFVRSFAGRGFEPVQWTAVEYSAVSAALLRALRPEVTTWEGPFERWVRDEGEKHRGKIRLIVANPPYGERGAAVTDDPDRSYREKNAYAYFLRRCLWLLPVGGMAVFVIPSGFLSGATDANRSLREKVLRIAHVSAAYRLPSLLFPGANIVTDVIVFRGRGGTLAEVDEGDKFILEGGYFNQFPTHILGTEKKLEPEKKGQRYRYVVEGEFTKLPDLVERDLCTQCAVEAVLADGPVKRAGVQREMKASLTEGGPPEVGFGSALGLRIDTFLAAVARADMRTAAALWAELDRDLGVFEMRYGNPHASLPLKNAAKAGDLGIERLLSSYGKGGQRIEGLRAQPVVVSRVGAEPNDVVGVAEWLYRSTNKAVTVTDVYDANVRRVEDAQTSRGKQLQPVGHQEVFEALIAAEWCADAPSDRGLTWLPKDAYLTGNLWARFDRARELTDLTKHTPANQAIPELTKGTRDRGVTIAEVAAPRQVRWLTDAIGPVQWDEIHVTPRDGWVPLDIIEQWATERFISGGHAPKRLIRMDGLVTFDGHRYDEIDSASAPDKYKWFLGWLNHDREVFTPSKPHKDDNIDEVRLKVAKEWEQHFAAWVASTPDDKVRNRIAEVYNRQMRGWTIPEFTSEPIAIARWTKTGHQLKAHQNSGVRRVLHYRRGLVAYDVGVGKTFTGLAIIAKAKEEGWVKRPVVLVPNSIVWKWYRDVKRQLPDYRVLVIGSKAKLVTRGKGLQIDETTGRKVPAMSSEVDTPEDRAEKWTRFQAGEADLVILAYSALGRTRMNEDVVRQYAEQTEAIQRQVKLRQRNAKDQRESDDKARRKGKEPKRGLSERQDAILKEGAAAWVAEKMEIPEGWAYDPGIAWDDIGIDMLVVDEAQNFKNLYLPEPREGGVPKFMGAAGEGAGRAWQLDFRAAAVRRRTGGSGVVLLSATPAKNSPLEFYNLIQLVDHDAWTRQGIRDPEQFIDRYLTIELKSVMSMKLEAEQRSAVVGFRNLHELRDVIFRYGEFKTAADASLKLPQIDTAPGGAKEGKGFVRVAMNAAQSQKYDSYLQQLEDALEASKSRRDSDAGAKILGLLARLSLVSIHPELDMSPGWADAMKYDPHAPKIDACADNIASMPGCGHIVFVDNIAVHRWLLEVITERMAAQKMKARGMTREAAEAEARSRIAILNAEQAKASSDRQRIAQEFNGDPDEGIPPRFDVVIANQVAYEGIDLQTRTCAIHHIDLPFEPATLEQRNGRGVRQGNREGAIGIYYYFADRSLDAWRFGLIQGKADWMKALIKSQDRVTNNPGAQISVDPDELFISLARDPEKARAKQLELLEKRAAEDREKRAKDASRTLKAAATRFARARILADTDPDRARVLRAEGDVRIEELARVPADAWAWAPWASEARLYDMLVPDGDFAPVYEGLRVSVAKPHDKELVNSHEFGRIVTEGNEPMIGHREAGQGKWNLWREANVRAESIRPEHRDVPWPADDDDRTRASIEQEFYYWRGMGLLGWSYASDTFIERWWPEFMVRIHTAIGRATHLGGQHPVVSGANALGLKSAGELARLSPEALIPPTRAGYWQFLRLAKADPKAHHWQALNDCAMYWWKRKIPQDLLATAKNGKE